MKALTMTQPWASLVAIGENTIETRSWSTRYRGPIAIHAAKRFPPEARALCATSPFRETLAGAGYTDADELPLGAIIAVARLDSVLAFERSTLREIRARARRGEVPRHEADFGDFSAGRFGFVLRDVRLIAEPIPASGMLGLWELPRDLEAAALRRIGTAAPKTGARRRPTVPRFDGHAADR
jgi:hypothetical protein